MPPFGTAGPGRNPPAPVRGSRAAGRPVADEEKRRVPGGGAQLQAAAFGEAVDPLPRAQSADDRPESARCGSLLQCPEQVLLPGGGHHEQTVRLDAETGQAVAVKRPPLLRLAGKAAIAKAFIRPAERFHRHAENQGGGNHLMAWGYGDKLMKARSEGGFRIDPGRP